MHDQAKVLSDLAVTLVVGGDCLADLAVLRAEPVSPGVWPRNPAVRVVDALAANRRAALTRSPTTSAAARPVDLGRSPRPGRRARRGPAAGDRAGRDPGDLAQRQGICSSHAERGYRADPLYTSPGRSERDGEAPRGPISRRRQSNPRPRIAVRPRHANDQPRATGSARRRISSPPRGYTPTPRPRLATGYTSSGTTRNGNSLASFSPTRCATSGRVQTERNKDALGAPDSRGLC